MTCKKTKQGKRNSIPPFKLLLSVFGKGKYRFNYLRGYLLTKSTLALLVARLKLKTIG